MNAENKKPNLLEACLAVNRNLADLIEYASDSIVSKTILDKTAGTITLFAFDKGQRLSEHQTPYDAVVQVIEGRAAITIGGKQVNVSAGEIIIMPGNVPHAVAAEHKFKMLLTMIRTQDK
ncbi:MAG TPA: cupin domain-containing protein [Sedimentisphaerales bacterium]|nr:cupin domain-containing protein [Sedimentisphaerales bacterium]